MRAVHCAVSNICSAAHVPSHAIARPTKCHSSNSASVQSDKNLCRNITQVKRNIIWLPVLYLYVVVMPVFQHTRGRGVLRVCVCAQIIFILTHKEYALQRANQSDERECGGAHRK